MLFGMNCALDQRELDKLEKVLIALKNKEITKIGFMLSTGEKIYLDVDIADFDFGVTERNRTIGSETVTDKKMFSIMIKGLAE